MRVLIATRSDILTRRGGDTVQYLQYVKELAKLRVQATLDPSPRAAFHGFDLLHIGGVDRILESLWFTLRAKRAGIRTVISPIFHPRERVSQFDSTQRREHFQRWVYRLLPNALVELARSYGYAIHSRDLVRPAASLTVVGPERGRRLVLEAASCWCLIASEEGDALRHTFHVRPKLERLIRNGVPDEFLSARPGGDRHGILIVGRIEARKNQLVILQALRGVGVPITVVGAQNQFHRKYCEAVLREIGARPDITYVPEVAHDQMRDIYRRHSVHVSASWYEVAPLVDLEAAASGCAVVATRAGYTNEYLGDSALYVDPVLGQEHLRATIIEALDRAEELGKEGSIKATAYRWSDAAHGLRDVYHEILDNHHPSES